MTSRTRSFVLALTLAFATGPLQLGAVPLAAAQGDDTATKQARARFQEGVDHFDKGRYDAARASFLQAYALKKHPSLLLNLGQSCLKGGHPLDAARYFQQFLREGGSQASPAQRESAESGLAEAGKKVGVLEVSAPTGSDVTVDGDRAGTAPLPEVVYVEPGAHTVSAGADTQKVSVAAGQRVPVRLQAAETPPTPAPVPAAPPADEPPPAEPPPKDEAAPVSKKTNLFSPPKSMVPVYVGLGVGAAGLAGAIVFGIAKGTAQANADDVANQIRATAVERGRSPSGVCTDPSAQAQFGSACQLLQDNNGKVDTNAAIANVSLVVMAVGFVGAGIYYLAAPKKDDAETAPPTARRRLDVVPLATPQGGGLSLGGTF